MLVIVISLRYINQFKIILAQLKILISLLKIPDESSSPYYLSLAIFYYNAANAYEQMGDYHSALQRAEQSAEIARQAYSDNHSEVAENQAYLDHLR